MSVNKKLLMEYENGNGKSYSKLVENNLYIVEKKLEMFEYDKKYKEDLLQDGYIKLIYLIKRYLSGEYDIDLITYLHNGIKAYYMGYIYKYTDNEHMELLNGLNYADSDTCDFIERFEDIELAKKWKNYLFKTDNLTFKQKTILMAHLGIINDVKVSNHFLSKAFSCTDSEISRSLNYAILECRRRKKMSTFYDEGDTDLFSYLSSSRETVMYCMKKLSKRQIDLLKIIWGNNFLKFNDSNNIPLSIDEVKEYYNIIGTLYSILKSTDWSKVVNKMNGDNAGYVLRK